MYKKFMPALLILLSLSVFAKAGGVTNIKEVVNNTHMTVEVRKYDVGATAAGGHYETTKEIPADGGTWSGDMWIPWADNSNDFTEKYMEIRIYRGTAFWLWQSGEFVRFNNRARFVENGRRVPGEARAGGERRLIISMSASTPIFKFEKL